MLLVLGKEVERRESSRSRWWRGMCEEACGSRTNGGGIGVGEEEGKEK